MTRPAPYPTLAGRQVLLLSWRDTGNPEGGGAERYLEQIAAGLVERGARVTLMSAAYPGAPTDEVDQAHPGIRYLRRGDKLTVYLQGMWLLLSRQLGRVDVVVDVQNGLPFFSRLVTRRPVVVLVHHVHREQWPVVYPGLRGRIGWLIESRLAPWLYRRCQYVTVSRATREELERLGVDACRIAVVHNGTEAPDEVREVPKTDHPSICVVGRLVPHKRVEHAVDAVVRLRERVPGVRLTIVGSGWWENNLRQYVRALGADDVVEFTGFVDGVRKEEVYGRSWVMALPSLKEGWGLVIGEAARHDTPTVAYRAAGGTQESIVDGVSGLLVDSEDELVDALERVLTDADLRERLAVGARTHSGGYTWSGAREAFAGIVSAALRGEIVAEQDRLR